MRQYLGWNRKADHISIWKDPDAVQDCVSMRGFQWSQHIVESFRYRQRVAWCLNSQLFCPKGFKNCDIHLYDVSMCFALQLQFLQASQASWQLGGYHGRFHRGRQRPNQTHSSTPHAFTLRVYNGRYRNQIMLNFIRLLAAALCAIDGRQMLTIKPPTHTATDWSTATFQIWAVFRRIWIRNPFKVYVFIWLTAVAVAHVHGDCWNPNRIMCNLHITTQQR